MSCLFDDNVLIASPRDGRGEFLSIAAFEVDNFHHAHWVLCRYHVPGRFDLYSFDY